MFPTLAVVATVTGLCSAGLPVVQIRKMLRDRSAGGVSVLYLAGSLANGCIWLAYGITLGNVAVIASNALWIAMCATMIAIAATLRRPLAAHAA